MAGLAEMRRLIGLLRDSGGDAAPAAAPTLAGLDALIARARANGEASGLSFTLDDTTGEVTPLPAPVELAAYRIVQESLTNALKHADPGEVAVRLAEVPGRALTVTVTSVYGTGPGPRAPGSGAGLVGMRERVALLGGDFDAGPVEGALEAPAGGASEGPPGGPARIWQVRAVLPLRDDKEPSA